MPFVKEKKNIATHTHSYVPQSLKEEKKITTYNKRVVDELKER